MDLDSWQNINFTRIFKIGEKHHHQARIFNVLSSFRQLSPIMNN